MLCLASPEAFHSHILHAPHLFLILDGEKQGLRTPREGVQSPFSRWHVDAPANATSPRVGHCRLRAWQRWRTISQSVANLRRFSERRVHLWEGKIYTCMYVSAEASLVNR